MISVEDTTFIVLLLGNIAFIILYSILAYYNRLTIKEMRESREYQTRPYVVFDFEFQEHLIFYKIENLGNSPAYDVSIDFINDLEDSRGRKLSELKLFKNIPFIPPRKKIRYFFDSTFQFLKKDELEKEINDIEVKYSREPSSATKQSYYKEKYQFDFSIYRDQEFISQTSLDDVVDRLKTIESSLKPLKSLKDIFEMLKYENLENMKYELINFLKENEGLTYREVTKKLGWSLNQTYRILLLLENEGKLKNEVGKYYILQKQDVDKEVKDSFLPEMPSSEKHPSQEEE